MKKRKYEKIWNMKNGKEKKWIKINVKCWKIIPRRISSYTFLYFDWKLFPVVWTSGEQRTLEPPCSVKEEAWKRWKWKKKSFTSSDWVHEMLWIGFFNWSFTSGGCNLRRWYRRQYSSKARNTSQGFLYTAQSSGKSINIVNQTRWHSNFNCNSVLADSDSRMRDRSSQTHRRCGDSSRILLISNLVNIWLFSVIVLHIHRSINRHHHQDDEKYFQ